MHIWEALIELRGLFKKEKKKKVIKFGGSCGGGAWEELEASCEGAEKELGGTGGCLRGIYVI